MKGEQTLAQKEKWERKNRMEMILKEDLDAHAAIRKCADFKFEKTALQVVIEDRGHVLILSPICTPELAGGGLEYAWGKLKYEHRKKNAAKDKLSGGAEFFERILQLCTNKEHLPMSRIWKFQRRARDYIRLYDNCIERNGASALTYKEIETQKQRAKTHRCVGEGVERVFIRES